MTTDTVNRSSHRRPARMRMGLGAAALASAALLSGCAVAGSPAAAATPSGGPAPPTSIAPADPEMVMVTLSDRGYHASDIGVDARRTLMLMVVNPGTRAHQLRAALSLTGLETDNPASPAASDPAAPSTATGFDVTVPAGQEIDLTFTPTAAGRYAMSDGSASVSALVVGPPTGEPRP